MEIGTNEDGGAGTRELMATSSGSAMSSFPTLLRKAADVRLIWRGDKCLCADHDVREGGEPRSEDVPFDDFRKKDPAAGELVGEMAVMPRILRGKVYLTVPDHVVARTGRGGSKVLSRQRRGALEWSRSRWD